MKHGRYWIGGVAALAAAVGVWAAVGTAATPTKHSEQKLTKITFQLKWVTQAQFAGYYAAAAKGFYKKAGLDVKIRVGGPDISPEQVVAGGQAQMGLDWLPSLMSARDQGLKLINIAQVFTRSGMTEITWKDSGINTIPKMRGKKVGNWLLGNEFELFAALSRAGMDPVHNKGVTIVKQPFDMNLFLNRQIDAASAMTYNELAQVLETKNPKTGNLHLKDCVKIVLSHGPTLLKGHQTWQMNEINALIWPSPNGIGLMNAKDYAFTAKTTAKYNKLKKVPGHEAYRTDIAKAAQALVKKQHLDIYGKTWKKANVKVTPGGK